MTTYILQPGTASFQAEEGWTVLCREGVTVTQLPRTQDMAKGFRRVVQRCEPWTVGRHVKLWGKRTQRTHTLVADEIVVDDEEPDPVTGYALVDRLLRPATAGDLVVRADGYVLRTTPETKWQNGNGAIKTASAVTTNMWVRYVGRRQLDNSVLVAELLITPNTIAAKETRLRDKSQFDPAAVTASDRQSGLNKFFFGLNGKRVPAYDNAAMQARIERVGSSLVPAYQRALPHDDPSRIDFSFNLVDLSAGPETIPMSNGIILVPYQILDELDDPQLATVLATAISTVLQKQDLRFQTAGRAFAATNAAVLTAGVLFSPLGGLALYEGSTMKESAMMKAAREQDQRVAMGLLHDAGYDLTAAPMAWWRLHSNPKKAMPNGAMPPAAEYAYHLLGTVWRDTLAGSVPLASTAAGAQ